MRKRTLYLSFSSLLVSFATYIQFPHTWVYFGILHFILLASWVALLFLPYPKITLFSILFILIGKKLGYLHMHTLFTFLQPKLHLPPNHTEDLVIFFPWFSIVLIGVLLVQYNKHKQFLTLATYMYNQYFHRILAFMGRHTLILYLIHQPIFFGLLLLNKE